MPFYDDWVRFPRGGAQENRRRIRRPIGQQKDLIAIMNNTKWRKLRTAMLSMGSFSPSYRIMNVEYGNMTHWDGEWFYHFNHPDYAFIEWLDLKPRNPSLRGALHKILKRLHLPGEEIPDGFRVFGYSRREKPLDYIR